MRRAALLAAAAITILLTNPATARATAPAAATAPGAAAAPEGAAAPARCPESAPAGGQQITAVPWAQERYAPQRLGALADGAGITVAVIDSGVDAAHPQLTGRVRGGADLLDAGDGTVDCVPHGTAVASIIAARPVPGVGFRGLAPGVSILPLRVSELQVLEGEASGRAVTAEGLAQAIRLAVTRGAAVINLSLVLYRDDPAVRAAVRFALDRDVVVVAAVGNMHDRGNPTPYPAAYEGVLAVGAIAPDGSRVPGSQVGSYVDIMAPGGQITAAARVRGHATYGGTSFAAPFVAATAALVRQYWPGLAAAAVVRRIVATADPAPGGRRSNEYGYGVLNPYRAVTERVTTGAPEQAAPLPVPKVDPAQVEAAADRASTRRSALTMAAGAGTAAGVVVILATVIPRARRRTQPAPTSADQGT